MNAPPDTHTLACSHGDFSHWHRGRRRYGVWAIAADTPPVAAWVARLKADLGPWLLHGYSRQPHITVAVGGFPGPKRQEADDYSAAGFSAQHTALLEQAPPPFTLELGALATFSSAPYLQVGGDTGSLGRLRQALVGAHPEPDPGPYTPHLTLGLYGGPYPLPAMRARLAALSTGPGLTLEVRQLALMTYAAAVIGGPLETVARFDLESRCLEADSGVLERLFSRP